MPYTIKNDKFKSFEFFLALNANTFNCHNYHL